MTWRAFVASSRPDKRLNFTKSFAPEAVDSKQVERMDDCELLGSSDVVRHKQDADATRERVEGGWHAEMLRQCQKKSHPEGGSSHCKRTYRIGAGEGAR